MNGCNFSLEPFQENAFTQDFRISGHINRNSNLLSIRYELSGKRSDILLPEKSARPTRTNHLWEHTCFEFFVAVKDLPHYWEFNLSPSGNWNVYRFQAYRKGMAEESTYTSLPFQTQNQPESFRLHIECDLKTIIDESQPIEMAVSTVVKHKSGEMSYWALDHRGSRPDFHLRDAFILEL